MLFKVALRCFDLSDPSSLQWVELDVVGKENALYIAERFIKAANVNEVLIIDALTGEIIWDEDN